MLIELIHFLIIRQLLL